MRSKTPRRLHGGPEPPKRKERIKHTRKFFTKAKSNLVKSSFNSDTVNAMIGKSLEDMYPEYQYEKLNPGLSDNGEHRLNFQFVYIVQHL